MDKNKLAQRHGIIQLYKKGKKQTEISYLMDIPQTTVSYCIRKYNSTGKLEDKPRSGKPAKLSNEQLNGLKKVLLNFPPSRYGGESMGWLTRVAIQYVFDTYGVKYSMRRMQELFHDIGLNLITPRTEHVKASYAARTVYRLDFKKNSKKNIWIAPSLISTK
jgi:transposase